MKKLLVLLTLMVAIFGFTAGAFSADVCTSCKGALRNVPCPSAAAQASVTCTEFDYDLNSPAAQQAANVADGYCLTVVGAANPNNYRAIFAICNCANAAKFIVGQAVAAKMTILVNGMSGALGAYWSQIAATPAIVFDTHTTAALACAITAHGNVGVGAGQSVSSGTFGAPSWFLSDGTTPAVPLATTVCTVPAANQATVMTTPASAYVVAGTEGPYWWIDVPPIRIDPAVLKNGELVSVKIELYDPTAPVPICPACVVSLCDCTIPVAQVCCAAAVSTTLSFPYFTSLTAGDFWNGISISNPTAAAGSCVLTAYEKDGSVGTATVAVGAKSMFVDLLENIVWAGTGLGGVQCYMTAVCNYGGAFGFAMMANGVHDSMGYKVP